MPRIPIDSIDDPRIAVFRNLHTTRMERRHGRFIAEGMWLARRLLTSPFAVDAILVDEKRLDEIGMPIPDSVNVYVAPNGLTEKVVGFNFHRGIVACGIRPPVRTVASLEGLDREDWLIVVCADVQDPENVGTILRSAAAFGARGVILGPRCSDPLSRRVLRVSMGAPFRLDVVQSDDLFQDLAFLRQQFGATIAATVLDDQAEPLASVRTPARMCLVFGSEGFGLERAWWEFSDRRLTIPMSPDADSLNVAVACGIFLHHFLRVAERETRAEP